MRISDWSSDVCSSDLDGSLFEYLQAFGAGATMVVAPPGIYGGEDLAQLLAEHAVTHAFVTTAALASVDPAGLEQLSEVVFGGEACPPDLVARWAPGRSEARRVGKAGVMTCRSR